MRTLSHWIAAIFVVIIPFFGVNFLFLFLFVFFLVWFRTKRSQGVCVEIF